MTIGEWLRHAKDALAESGCPDPQIDSRWIAEDTLGLSRSEMHFETERSLSPEEHERLEALLQRRVQGEPVQYLLNSACFMGLNFYVDSRVLIPRQDTETLVEAVIVALRQLEKDHLCRAGHRTHLHRDRPLIFPPHDAAPAPCGFCMDFCIFGIPPPLGGIFGFFAQSRGIFLPKNITLPT